MSSITGLLPFAALTTTLALATIIFYPSKTLSQTPSDGRNTVPQPGCLSGYPDGTYRGSRPVTRYEFAAGLTLFCHFPGILNKRIKKENP
ncbi:MAG: S-layer homology domain-containing protein, partial [Nostoc sp. DedQUE11]|nr:S-layer homology domain-containing protein [Nostoc sp. DedQUE11]